MTRDATGALLGLLVGLGLVLLSSWLEARRPRTPTERIAPFVGGSGARSARGRTSATALVAGLLRAPDHAPDATSDRGIAGRLERAGGTATVPQYRLERIGWAAVGATAGALVGIVLAMGGSSGAGIGLMATFGAVAGWWCREAVLNRTITRRRAAMERQLPDLADLAALAVAAGAAPTTALERASTTMTGPLADEVQRSAADIRGGGATDVALRAMAARTGLAPVQRFVDGILTALERGTPLVDLMRAQADDVRASEGRRLMELAGRKDVAMLVPIVFLVLPSVVLVAVYPGVRALQLVVP